MPGPCGSAAFDYGQLALKIAPSSPSVVGTDANVLVFAHENTPDALVPLSFGPAMPAWFV